MESNLAAEVTDLEMEELQDRCVEVIFAI